MSALGIIQWPESSTIKKKCAQRITPGIGDVAFGAESEPLSCVLVPAVVFCGVALVLLVEITILVNPGVTATSVPLVRPNTNSMPKLRRPMIFLVYILLSAVGTEVCLTVAEATYVWMSNNEDAVNVFVVLSMAPGLENGHQGTKIINCSSTILTLLTFSVDTW